MPASSYHLAQVNIALPKEPLDSALLRDFVASLESVMAAPSYESLGWRLIPGPTFCEQPGGRITMTELLPGNSIMVLLADGGTAGKRGAVDLCGLPF